MDEQETMSVSVESVETQSDKGEAAVGIEADQGTLESGMEPEAGILEQLPEDAVEASVDGAAADQQVSDTQDADRVEEIVDAVLSSERVTQLLDSFEYTLQTVADAVTATSVTEPMEIQEPIVVVGLTEVVDRLEDIQTEMAQLSQSTGKSSVMQIQSVPSMSAVQSGEIVSVSGGEVVPVGEGDISLTVIEALLESLISQFIEDGTEDDGDILVTIKDTIEKIDVNVEPHLLMETRFEDYTVLEGLLLIAVLWLVVLNPCIRMIKGGFSWLLS